MNKSFNATYFDEWAGYYTSFAQRRKWAVPGSMADTLAPYIPQKREMPFRVIDVGTGTGLLAHKLKKQYDNLETTGLDFSHDMAKECKKAANADLLVVADAEEKDFPFASGTFDLAIAGGVLEFFANPKHAIAEMIRVTKPDGLIAFSYMTTKRDHTHNLNTIIQREAYCRPAKQIEELSAQLGIHKLAHTEIFTGMRLLIWTPKHAIFVGRVSELVV